jgi:Fe2+ transport system protein FeoA
MKLKTVFNRLYWSHPMHLADVALGQVVTVQHVGGERAFRRRLMELGLVPGTAVKLVGVAPLGDPLELLIRGCSLSIRGAEARNVVVAPPQAVSAGSSQRREAVGGPALSAASSWSEGAQ